MAKRHENTARWIVLVSMIMFLGGGAVGTLVQDRLGPLPGIVMVAGMIAMFSAAAYIGFKPKLSPAKRKKLLVQAVGFYRGLGFFSEYADLPCDKLVSKLNAKYREKTNEPLDRRDSDADLWLLELDGCRVWGEDLKCGVMVEEDIYAGLVRRLGQISRGAFVPQDIKEVWESEKGPIRVEFRTSGVLHTLEPTYRGKWLDTDFLFKMAELFEGSGYELVIHPGDRMYATVLTPDEKRRIKRERGFVF
jgi:hypothetical protein